MPISGLTLRTILFALLVSSLARPQGVDLQDLKSAKRDSGEIQILYTGSLMGYFRIPDWQRPSKDKCGDVKQESKAATDFEDIITKLTGDATKNKLPGPILLGSGNNFSPEIEAREFCAPPPMQFKEQHRTGKDSFLWNDETGQWVPFEMFDEQSSTFKTKVLKGQGIIPEDNAARFLTEKGYAAIVPGRHDFYFGPERLRLLARRLATDSIPKDVAVLHNPGYGTQMLAANLVIETTWKSDHAPLTDKENPPRFIPRMPTAKELEMEENAKLELMDFPPGGNAYPWYPGPTLKLSMTAKSPAKEQAQAGQGMRGNAGSLKEVFNELKNLTIHLCEAPPGFDQKTKTPQIVNCRPIEFPTTVKEDPEKQEITVPIFLPWQDDTHTFTLYPGKQYRLCFTAQAATVKDMDGEHTFCLRLSVYRPFFQFPWGYTAEVCAGNQSCPYKDPDPYLVLERKTGETEITDVAIFGVVDPNLVTNIGLLNYGWINKINKNDHFKNTDFKTVVAAKDPADALKQLVAYHQRRQQEKKEPQDPSGGSKREIRVLMAEMSPQQAEVLAARVGKFQVVVTEADESLSKPFENDKKLVKVEPNDGDSARMPAVMLVPSPFFRPVVGKGITDIGFLGLQPMNKESDPESWLLTSFHKSKESCLYMGSKGSENCPKEYAETTKAQATEAETQFWSKIGDSSKNGQCVPGLELSQNELSTLQTVTMKLIQEETKADLVLLQKRDFFSHLPTDFCQLGVEHRTMQEILDRIIWKGDFLSLIFVPGSAIKKALEQSKSFDNEDSSALSLSDERSRGLITLGITPDAENNGYTVNGLPLDPNKLYAVATTDYISAGDTGYPDLATSQVSQPIVGTDFGSTLTSISSIVCRGLLNDKSDTGCEPDYHAQSYFDFLEVSPVDPREGKTPEKQLEIWSIFHPRPPAVPGSKAAKAATPNVEEAVQQRTLWDFALNKLTLGVTRLAHPGSSDFDIANNFSGITSPGVNSFSSTTITSDFQATWQRNFSQHQIYGSPAYTYNVQYKGQPDDFSQLNQIADLGSFDLGYLYSGSKRGPERFAYTFSEHFETPLTSAFNAFTLNATHTGEHGETIKDQLRFHIDRSYTLLTRPGVRWKKRVSSIEFGPEWGHEWNALTGINFTTGPTFVPCPAIATQTIGQCFKANVNAMRPTTVVTTTRNGQDHTGTYWKVNITVPFHPRISYVLTDTGDWFFVRYSTETSTTTLFRDFSQHQLKLTIFPSLSIGPELDVLLYRNKTVGPVAPSAAPLRGHFLFQDQLIMKAQWSFDLFNKHEMPKQIEYAPPTGSK